MDTLLGALRHGVRPRRRAARAAQPGAGRRRSSPSRTPGRRHGASGAVTAWLQDGAIHVANGGSGRRRGARDRHDRRRGVRRPAVRLDHAGGRRRAGPPGGRSRAGRGAGGQRNGEGRPAADGHRRHVDRHPGDRAAAALAALRRQGLHRRRGCDRRDLRRDGRRRRLLAPRRRDGRQLDLGRRPRRLRAHGRGGEAARRAGRREARHQARRRGHRPDRQRRAAQGPRGGSCSRACG